jgi:hypothetical protein
MKRGLQILGSVVGIIILVIATTLLIHTLFPLRPTKGIEYVDLITIVLSALSIMITILGLFVAALALIGWTTFENKLRDNSLSYLTSELSKEGKLRKEFETILTDLSLQGVRAEEAQQLPESTPEDAGERPYND